MPFGSGEISGEGKRRNFLLRLGFAFLMVFTLAPTSDPQQKRRNIGDNGNEFLEVCKALSSNYNPDTVVNDAVCVGWVEGFIEGVYSSEEYQRKLNPSSEQKKMMCPPSDVSYLHCLDIIRKYIEEHRERAHMKSRHLAYEALAKVFPCGT